MIAKNIYEMLQDVCARNKDSIFFVRQNETYAELLKKVKQRAVLLKQRFKIKKGDTVMLVLKRHYQFWFCMLALHKIGAIAIPATNQLVEHDFDYRYKAARVKAIVCTADGDVSQEAEKAAANPARRPGAA